MATIKVGNMEVSVEGAFPTAGDRIPDFNLLSSRMKPVSLSRYRGKLKILATVPSVDTYVCANNARHLEQLASQTPAVECLLISADLPFALARFAKAEQMRHLQLLSTLRSAEFAEDYGVKMIDGPLQGLLARALWVIDAADRVVYSELVADVGEEPDYTAAASALG